MPDHHRYDRYLGALRRAWRSPCFVDLRRFLASVPAVDQPRDWSPPGVQPEDPAQLGEVARP